MAALSLHSLLELRSLLLRAVLLFDLEATTLEQVADLAIEALIQAGELPEAELDKASTRYKHRHNTVFFLDNIRIKDQAPNNQEFNKNWENFYKKYKILGRFH